MIYGRIATGTSDIFNASLGDLKDLMEWPGSIHHEVVFGNFSGGFIYDPRLPYNPDDFYYLDHNKKVIVMMSGVIYNRDEITKQLSLKNHLVTDPELVFAAFSKWGEEFVNQLNGDFAIFIHSTKTETSFLYRDHMGVKPLVFSTINSETWFSSDTMALSKVLYSREGIDRQFLFNQLVAFGLSTASLLQTPTVLPSRKIKRLLPGHFISLSTRGLVVKKYWSPEDIREERKLDFEAVIYEINNLLRDAVKIRSDKRFKASTHLSGGLDSGIVASLARKEFDSQKEFPGFCWTSLGPVTGTFEFDERELVEKLGKFLGIKPIFTSVDQNEMISFLSDWRHITDLHYEKNVRENGLLNKVNLIFSGWGGDEFLSMNNLCIDSDLVFKFHWRTFFKKNPLHKPKKLIYVILFNVILPALSLRYYSPKKPLSFHSKYIKHTTSDKAKTINDLFFWKSRREMHLRYLYNYHIPERTEDWNIFGTRSGIEYRYPLIDKRIIEFMLKVPSRLLVKNGYSRILIREISEGLLPEEIRWHVSKNDPVRMEAYYDVGDEVCEKLMNEVDDFKSNAELSFINFELLIKDISAYRKGLITKRPHETFEILFFLKKAHEFIKTYNYSND